MAAIERTFTDAVEWLLRSVIRQALGWAPNSVRKANQEYPRGNASEEFATVLVPSLRARGQLEIVQEQIIDEDTEVIDETHLRQNCDSLVAIEASVNFYRSKSRVDAKGIPHSTNRAFDFAFRLPQLLCHPEIRILLDRYGLTFQGAGTAQNLTGLVEGTVWESRGQIDLRFGVANRESFVLNTFQVVRLGLSAVGSGPLSPLALEVTT